MPRLPRKYLYSVSGGVFAAVLTHMHAEVTVILSVIGLFGGSIAAHHGMDKLANAQGQQK